MVCTTIRNGVECTFMTAQGCSYNGGLCHETVETCNGCNRVQEFSSGWYCTACPEPSLKWKNGNCNLASHVTIEKAGAKQKINPLKASKRGNK
jgi:predicted amidophosphoribosyltransferase